MQKHTGQDIDRIERDCDRDKWLDAEQAKEYGVVDEILQSLPDSFQPSKDDDED